MKSGMRHGLAAMKDQIFGIKHLAGLLQPTGTQRDLMRSIERLEETLQNTIAGWKTEPDDIEIACRTIAVEYSCHRYSVAHQILKKYGAVVADEMEARYLPIVEALSKPTPEPSPNYPNIHIK